LFSVSQVLKYKEAPKIYFAKNRSKKPLGLKRETQRMFDEQKFKYDLLSLHRIFLATEGIELQHSQLRRNTRIHYSVTSYFCMGFIDKLTCVINYNSWYQLKQQSNDSEQQSGYYWAGSLLTTVRYHELFDLICKSKISYSSNPKSFNLIPPIVLDILMRCLNWHP